MNPNLCILTFPQYYKNGRITFHIVIIPRNINPLLPLEDALPAFADTKLSFSAMIINTLDGLPLSGNAIASSSLIIENQISSSREVWEAVKLQLEASEQVKVDDQESRSADQRAEHALSKYKNVSIRKYLPETYRASFNFVKPKTKFALTGDEYSCAIKNKNSEIRDLPTDRRVLSWGKVVAFCLRNPVLAEKAGLIYKASIAVKDPDLYENGGWIYTNFAADCPFAGRDNMKYAARIPALKGVPDRQLFSAVQFPVSEIANNDAGYDELLREAIIYDDGYAKIVHANQPVNQDLLSEKDKSNPPLKDIGIRLGWDDEQIAIWYNRQMLKKEELSGREINSPLGIFGYRVDVRESDESEWCSQNSLILRQTTALSGGRLPISMEGDLVEPGMEIHPTSHGDSENDGFWLPMYFSSWMGKPVTMADQDVEEISQLTFDQVKQPLNNDPSNTINLIPKKTFHPYMADPKHVVDLRYGRDYQFRVRLMDISGGGPTVSDKMLNGGEKPTARLHFKRHVGAGPIKVVNAEEQFNLSEAGRVKETNLIQNFTEITSPVLKFKRPLLAYPAVIFTGKYADPIQRLKSILADLPLSGDPDSIVIGLADPDVKSFTVRVEAQSLIMDNALSQSGKESYVELYTRGYAFDANDLDREFELKIIYLDIKHIDLGNPSLIPGEEDEIVLPTARHLRLIITPIVDGTQSGYADAAIEKGKTVTLTCYQPSMDESALLLPIDGGLKAVYLQPEDPIDVSKVKLVSDDISINFINSSTPIELSRLAERFNLSAHQLTLSGEPGKRMQFGCSKLMRHSLAPDSSSLSFSSLSELFNHWIIGINYTLDRDWAWNALETESISVFRKWKKEADHSFCEEILAGTINVSQTVAISALSDPQRSYSRLLFLDAFDPKEAGSASPSEVILSYRLVVNFNKNLLPVTFDAAFGDQQIHLPVTIIPAQIPKLISAGIALSEYVADAEKYASTEPRQRYLWLEMDSPPNDKQDTYFARVLSHAPDPYLCRINSELINYSPNDPPININEEKVRVIIPKMDNDFAGMGAMQEMIPAHDEKNESHFYMLPLPPGLHAESDELFGFFSYEIRLGHRKETWSTAQGRYGRPLRVNGVQHPAPNLSCNAFRRKIVPLTRRGHKVYNSEGKPEKYNIPGVYTEEIATKVSSEIIITAPFATAVLDGKNLTADPPQTSLWYMLYTQVKQADGNSFRNLLLSSGHMSFKRRPKPVSDIGNQQKEEGEKRGVAVLQLTDIQKRLKEMGLSPESSLSVLCVEMFPLQNNWQMENGRRSSYTHSGQMEHSNAKEPVNPLTTGLGNYRIYRTSALVPISDVCCDDC
ncbi:MAG: hypothetical protein EOO20_04175 [Chryseobacterium sp.]|nr:MAG: hypothetical protein EOO20_04175 [Chryseobacterium sp.]